MVNWPSQSALAVILSHSLSPVGGAPSSVFTKKSLPTGLPLGSYQLFNWSSTLKSHVSRWASCGLRLLFDEPSALSTIPYLIESSIMCETAIEFLLVLPKLAWEMWAIITLDNIRGRYIWESRWQFSHGVSPISLPTLITISKWETTSTPVRMYQYPTEAVKSPMLSISQVDHKVFPSLIM